MDCESSSFDISPRYSINDEMSCIVIKQIKLEEEFCRKLTASFISSLGILYNKSY